MYPFLEFEKSYDNGGLKFNGFYNLPSGNLQKIISVKYHDECVNI